MTVHNRVSPGAWEVHYGPRGGSIARATSERGGRAHSRSVREILRSWPELDDTRRAHISGLAVPFGELTEIGGGDREVFMPGAVHGDSAPPLMWLHPDDPDPGAGLVLGDFVTARSERDGWFAVWRLRDDVAANDAIVERLEEPGDLGMSVGFRPLVAPLATSGIKPRVLRQTLVELRHVALTPRPAYKRTLGRVDPLHWY